MYDYILKNKTISIDVLFTFLIVFYLLLGMVLIFNIPYGFPYGGPDEPMHISMAIEILNNMHWPDWDSLQLLRSPYGVSYSTGSSIVYWLHAFTFGLFQTHRLGSYILFIVYLLISTLAYRKNRIAGYFMLAFLFPQVIFVFSYVNADVGTMVTALLFGLSVSFFVFNEKKYSHLLYVFFFAGLSITGRQHLWLLSFIILIIVLFIYRKTILEYSIKKLLLLVVIGLLPASWWFITSYLHNDGDILGIFTNAKSIVEFSQPNLPILARQWIDINLYDFFKSLFTSFYATWGWMNIQLSSYSYSIVLIFILIILFQLKIILSKKIILTSIILFIVNILLLIAYSIFYDYQPQGRYLFPSFFLIIGLIVGSFISKNMNSNKFLILLILLSLVNVLNSVKLASNNYISDFWTIPTEIRIYNESVYNNYNLFIDSLIIDKNKLSVNGWAYDTKNNKPFESISLIITNSNNTYEINLKSKKREDVAVAFNKNGLLESGFYLSFINISNIKKGKYSVYFSFFINGERYSTEVQKEINF